MKNTVAINIFLLSALFIGSCSENLDPLAPGSTDGKYSLGIKSLMPLAVGNSWKYNVTVYDTNGAAKTQYTFTLSVRDTVTADTGSIPLLPPSTTRKNLKREALVWYLLQGELGTMTCWQVDSLEKLRVRKSSELRFYEQTTFDFRASIGDSISPRYVSTDTARWGSGDNYFTTADSIKTKLVSKGVDTLRTTLGSAPYFQYREYYSIRSNYTEYYYKPGFGLFLKEYFEKTPGGKIVRTRRDELVSYYFK